MPRNKSDPTPPQLLLLPGFLCDAELWREQIAALTGRVHCQVGDFSTGQSIADLAARVLATADPSFALAGFSFGGYVAQEILRQAPERVTRLALLDSSQRADTPEQLARRAQTARAVSRAKLFTGMTRHNLPTFIHPDRLGDQALVARLQAMNQRLGKQVFLRQNAMARQDGSAVLRRVTCPTLVLCGDGDRLTQPGAVRQMAALIPQARFQLIANSGHMTPMEQPAAVAAALRDWLDW